jgi:hypothetical protein
MNRRRFLHRAGISMLSVAASALPAVARAPGAALSTVRDSLGWIAVVGQRGDVLIRISPRFALEHPAEALGLIRTGRLP